MSKMTIAIAGAIVVAALGAPLVLQQQTIRELRQEIETLKQQVATIAPLQEQLDHATQDAASAGGSAESQKHELVRLRAEVSKLRGQTGDLAKARQQIETLNQRLEFATATSRDQAAALQDEAQKRQSAQNVENKNACLNNIRLLDSAKQQWALENSKQAPDTPTMEDLLRYLGHGPNNTNMPSCPDGGVYTLGPVGELPTCSIPGHVLPR